MLADLVPQLSVARFSPAHTKHCCMCGQDKPLSEYAADNRTAGGLQRSCKQCLRQYNRRWYKARGKQMRKAR